MKSALAIVFLAGSLQAAITGTLIDEAGKPLAGAIVRAFAAEDSSAYRARVMRGGAERATIGTAQSAESGAFRIDAPKTPLADLVIEAGGKVPLALEAPDGEDLHTLVLRARPGQKLHLVAGGKPVSNAIVAAGPFLLHSGADGSVELPEWTGMTGRGAIIHPDYAPNDFYGEEGTPRDLTLSRGVAVGGRVLTAEGQPAPNVTVTIGGWPMAQSAADGSFAIAHAPLNWRTIVATDATRAGSATRSGAKPYNIRLKPAASISGKAMAGARVIINREMNENEFVNADSQGNFVSPPLIVGRYGITAVRRGYAAESAQVTLQEGVRATRSLSPKPLARLRGRVIGEDQQPVPGAFVWFGSGWTVPRHDLVTTGKNGEFNVPRAPGQQQAIFVLAAGYATGTSGPIGEGKNDITVKLSHGFPLQVHVIDRQRQSVSGVTATAIAGADNDPSNVRYQAACEEPLSYGYRTTGDDGVVRLRATEGTYSTRVMGPSIVTKMTPQALTAKSSPLFIEVDRGVEVSGRVTYSDNTPVAGAFISTRPYGFNGTRTNDDGTFTLPNLQSGKIMLIASTSEQPQMQSAPSEVNAPARNVVLTIPAPARIEGRVSDKDTHQPLTDFQIAVINLDNRSSFGRPPSFHSDDGSFVLDHLAAGSMRLQVAASGYAPGSVSDLTTEEGKTLRGVEVQLERGGQLRGRVTASGQPVSGVSVRSGQSFGGGAATDDNGEYLIDGIGAGDRTIDFYKEGFLPKRKNVDVAHGKETRLDAEIERGRDLTGRVIDKAGHPIAGARVVVATVGGHPSPTDADGSFTIEGLADGHYVVNVNKEGYITGRSNDVVVPATAPLTITLDSGGTITGHVTGLSDAELAATDISGSGGGSNAHTRVNPDGTFVLRGVPDGHIGVMAFAHGTSNRQSAPKFVDVVNGSAPSVEIDFNEGITVSGHVTRGGAPFSGGNVNFSGPGKMVRGAGVSPDGRYELNGLEAGDYDVQVFGPGGVLFRGKYSVAGNSTYDIQIQGATLRGRVVDGSTGAPVSEANVWIASSKDNPMRRQVMSDSDGRFMLDVLPDGTFDIHASSPRQHYAPANQPVTISGGSAPEVELRLDSAQATAFHVVDAQSGAPLDAFISVSSGNTVVANGGGARDEDNAIRIYLAPGQYKAHVNARGYSGQTTDFSAPSPDVRVALQAAGRLILTAAKPTRVAVVPPIPPSGGPVGGTVGRVMMATPMGTPMENLAPGGYTIRVYGDDGKTVIKSLNVTVTAGQTTTVNVD